MLMFNEADFAVFDIEGLDDRMQAIRERIQPKFQELNEYFVQQLNPIVHVNFFIHIAQHRRRTMYAPENTWSALSQKKRGYKMDAHFQLGIFPEYIFMWLSFIDAPKNKADIAQVFLNKTELFNQLPEDFYVSLDHTKSFVQPLREVDLEKALLRFRDVKKGEFQIGRILKRDDLRLAQPEVARKYMLNTYQQLVPLYRQAIVFHT